MVMVNTREVDKLKVIEGYREPSSTTFDSSTGSIEKIKVDSGVEAEISFSSGKSRFYPWHRILNYEKK